MPKNILITNTNKESILYLKDLFALLKSNDFKLYFYANETGLQNYCYEQKLSYKKSNFLLSFDSLFFQCIFTIFLIPFLLYGLIVLLIFKTKYKINALACFSWQERIIFSFWTKMLGQKIIWIEPAGQKKIKLSFLLQKIILLFHAKAKIVVFNQKTKDKLNALKYKSDFINHISPGINMTLALRQENIFHDLAKTKNSNSKNNFYTIGTVVNLNKEQEIEIILGAIKKALNVIPNIQFIIIGEGPERKNLTWLAKKMEIGNLVWFVGEQAHLHKWLNSFNIFITASKDASFLDIGALLNAMSAGIPIITTVNHGYGDIINDENNGLVIEKNDSDLLSNAIIRINQDKYLAEKISQNAKKQVNEKYTDKIMSENFIKLL